MVRRRGQRRRRTRNSSQQHLEHQITGCITTTTGELKITAGAIGLQPRPLKIMRVHMEYRQQEVSHDCIIFSYALRNMMEVGVDFTAQSRSLLMSSYTKTHILRNTRSADFGFADASDPLIIITQKGLVRDGSDSVHGFYNMTVYVAYKMQQVRVDDVLYSSPREEEEIRKDLSILSLEEGEE